MFFITIIGVVLFIIFLLVISSKPKVVNFGKSTARTRNRNYSAGTDSNLFTIGGFDSSSDDSSSSSDDSSSSDSFGGGDSGGGGSSDDY